MSDGMVVIFCVLFTAFGFCCGGMFEIGRNIRALQREAKREARR